MNDGLTYDQQLDLMVLEHIEVDGPVVYANGAGKAVAAVVLQDVIELLDQHVLWARDDDGRARTAIEVIEEFADEQGIRVTREGKYDRYNLRG